jgi:hypothetical protein
MVEGVEGIRNDVKQRAQLAHVKLTARTGFVLDAPEISRLLWEPKFQYGTVKMQGLPLRKQKFFICQFTTCLGPDDRHQEILEEMRK